jgi:hypothetical protein
MTLALVILALADDGDRPVSTVALTWRDDSAERTRMGWPRRQDARPVPIWEQGRAKGTPMADGWLTCEHCGADLFKVGPPWIEMKGSGANRHALPRLGAQCTNRHENVFDGIPYPLPESQPTQEER